MERKRLERERLLLLEREQEARLRAEAAVRARDDVLRVVSHDLGNSLSAISIHTAVLLRTLGPEAADALERIGNIRDLARQMARLRQDLLDVASIEAGRLSIEPEHHEPAELLETALERSARWRRRRRSRCGRRRRTTCRWCWSIPSGCCRCWRT
jgi:K+-sensing histidine kinase KdpD